MRIFLPIPTSLADRMYRYLLAGALAGCLYTAAAAQPSRSQPADDLATLKNDVQLLKTQQQQILDGLNELKKLAKVSNGPPLIKAPETLSVAGEPFRGETQASVAIIEYADFECPFCRHFEHDTYPQIRDAYIKTGKVRYFYRDLPLPFHEHSMPAARATRCAAEQGKLWEMHDSLFTDPASLNPRDIDSRAGKLGLDVTSLDACVASERFADVIRRSINEATDMQISGTPTFLIGTLGSHGEIVKVRNAVVGARPFETFKAAIDPLLAAEKNPLASAN
jgi:protein-disulfide isomerase